MIQNPQTLLVCSKCKSEIDQRENRVYFKHEDQMNCSGVLCIWCCHQKIEFDQMRPNQKQDRYFMECCQSHSNGIGAKLQQFVALNCIICGPKCLSTIQINLKQTGLKVGKQCYIESKSKTGKSWIQEQILQQIDKFSQIQCKVCQNPKLHKIKSTCEEIDSGVCQKCSNEVILLQRVKFGQIKKCHECFQPEIINFQKTFLFFNKESKVFSLKPTQLKNNLGELLWECSRCYYLQYLQMRKQLEEGHLSKIDFMRKKIEFQQYFLIYCGVCAMKPESQDSVFGFVSQQNQPIFSFVCMKCQLNRRTNPKKYPCLQQITNFLKVTNQLQDYQNKNEMKKQQFDKTYSKQLQFFKESLEEISDYCRVCKSKKGTKKEPFNLIEIGEYAQCYVCVFERFLGLMERFKDEGYSKLKYLNQYMGIKLILSLKCLACGLGLDRSQQKGFYLIPMEFKCDLETGICFRCHSILFQGEKSMPNRGYLKLKIMLKRFQAYEGMKSANSITDFSSMQGRKEVKLRALQRQIQDQQKKQRERAIL